MKKKKLLIIAHSPSKNTKCLSDAVLRGASHSDIENVETTMLSPIETKAEDIISSDAVIIGTTENLGYMAGLVKDVFDRCYYDCIDATQGMPFSFYIRAGHDGTGTLRAIKSITTGLKWKLVQEPLVCRGDFDDNFIAQCEEFGLTISASLDSGII